MLLTNNFDGGTTGSTITTANSGWPGNDAFDYISSGATGVLQYADCGALGLARATAQYVMEMSSGAGPAPAAYAGYKTKFGSQSSFYTRFYVYFSAVKVNAGGDTIDTNLFSVYKDSGAPGVSIFLGTSSGSPQSLYIWNAFSSTFAQMTTVINAGQWYRVEFRATLSSSAGTADLFMYAGADLDTNTATESVSQTAQNYGTATVNTASLGMDSGWQLNTPAVYFSNWQINNTGYPGPEPFRQGKGSSGLPNPTVSLDAA